MDTEWKDLLDYARGERVNTSDAIGIRHGFSDVADVKFDDAKFMLVVCSGFVVYLFRKATEVGIDIKS